MEDMRKKPINVSSVFREDKIKHFAFEAGYITTLILLLTGLSVETSILNTVAFFSAILMSVLLLVRLIATSGRFANEDSLTSVNILLEFLFFYSFLYTALYISETLNTYFLAYLGQEVNIMLLTSLVGLGLFFTILLGLEKYSGDFMAYYSSILFNIGDSADNRLLEGFKALGLFGIEGASEDAKKELKEIIGTEEVSFVRKIQFTFLLSLATVAFCVIPFLVFGQSYLAIPFVIITFLMKGAVTFPFYRYSYSNYTELNEKGVRRYVNLSAIVLALLFFYVVGGYNPAF